MDYEFLLEDRLQKIRQIITKYGQDNFYMSFSGGKDSTVLSALVDMAIPNNTIPRVYANTGIEYKLILEFVEREREREHTWELIILKPEKNIKKMLEEEGYPFKSKIHARVVSWYQQGKGDLKSVTEYAKRTTGWHSRMCPYILQYQFENGWNDIKISDKCCYKLKKEPLKKFSEETNRNIAIIGIMPNEGGQRESAVCLAFKGKDLKAFQPLVPVTKDWEDWFIETYNIAISELYKPPYNFVRTGCKGCPFALKLQSNLDVLEKFFPEERKQCEIIWKPVYEEYRRLGYRLKKKEEYHQLRFDEIFDFEKGVYL